MEKEYVNIFKTIDKNILDCIENGDDIEENFQQIFNLIESNNIIKDKYEFKSFLYLISNIADNHYRQKSFFSIIEGILLKLKENIKNIFSNSEIFNIFHKNKKILLFLIEEQILEIDSNEDFLKFLEPYKDYKYFEYFSPEIEKINPRAKILDRSKYNNFDNYRKIGENEATICQIIREDNLNKFFDFLQSETFDLNEKIDPSIFETNPYLLKNSPSLIEYAAFHGSFEIFKFFFDNGATITPKIWLYAIHGGKIELIIYLDDNKDKLENITYEKYLKEAIKCHHNEITQYIVDNRYKDKNKIIEFGFHYHNYINIPDTFQNENIYKYICLYDYIDLLKLCLKTKKFNIDPLINIAQAKKNDEMVKLLFPYQISNASKNVQIKYVGSNNEMRIFSLWKQEKDSKIAITEEAQQILSASNNPCIVLFFGDTKAGKSTISSHLMAGCNADISQTYFQASARYEPCTKNVNAIGPIKCSKFAEQLGIAIDNPRHVNLKRDIFLVDSEGLHSLFNIETVWLKQTLVAMLPVNSTSFYVANETNSMKLDEFMSCIKLTQFIYQYINKNETIDCNFRLGYISNKETLNGPNIFDEILHKNDQVSNNMLPNLDKKKIHFDRTNFKSFSVVHFNQRRNEYLFSIKQIAEYIVMICLNEVTIYSGQKIVDKFNECAKVLKDIEELRDPNPNFSYILTKIIQKEMRKSIYELKPDISKEVTSRLDKYPIYQILNLNLAQFCLSFDENVFIQNIIDKASGKLQEIIPKSLLENLEIYRLEINTLIKDIAQDIYYKKIKFWEKIGVFGVASLSIGYIFLKSIH